MTTRNIVFIDSRVADFETFIASLGADTEWYLLDASLDGIGQMQSILAGYFSLDAIHVISHGSAGTLYLGSTALTNSNLSEYQNQLQVIGQSLANSGDILLYGCNVAAGDPGIQFIDNLANMTGADVAASNDTSGPTTLNGDSLLESQSGTIEATTLNLDAIATTLAVNAAPTFIVGDGKLTTAIGSGLAFGASVTAQSDGKILVAGSADNASGYSDFALVRYNTDGSLDTSFDGDGKVTTAIGTFTEQAHSVTVQSDGKILVAGLAYNASGYSDFALVRYNSDGSLDTTFDGDGKLTTAIGTSWDSGYSVTVQSDGKILVAGSAYNASGNYDFALVRYNTDGSLDTTFSGDGEVTTAIGGGSNGASVTVQSDGKILVAGYAYSASGNTDFALVRYNIDGSLDTTFDGDGKLTTAIGGWGGAGYSVTAQSDGKILVAGYANNASGYSDFALVRYNTDGSLDLAFHPVINSLDGTPSYTEEGSAVVLDGNVQIYDPELYALNNYASASLTLVRHGGANAEDQFSGVGIVAGQASGNVTVSSTVIGTYTWTDGSLTIAFNGSATQSLVDQAMQSLAYSNSSDTPPASVQIDWTFNDGNTGAQGDGGAISITGSTTVTITAVNDAPTLIAPTPDSYIDTAADDTFIAATGTLVGSDVDSATLTYGISGGTVTSGASSKTGLYGTFSVVTSSGAYTYTPNDAAIEGLKTDATDSFTISVSDGSLTTTQNYTVNMTGANDPTTAITGQTTGTVAEDGTLNAAGALSISDRDAADTSFVARSVAGTYGYLNIYSNGAWNYFLNNGTAIVQNLVVGQHVTDSFTVTTTGGLTQDVTIQIDGAGNSAPTFTASTGIVTTAVGTSYDVGSSVTLQPDGKILVAGYSNAGFALVRYNSDGSPDASFDGDGIVTTAIGMFNNYGSSVTLQPDGKILVAGSTEISGSGIDFALMRYNTDGSLDTTFSGDGKLNTQIGTNYDYGRSVTLQTDGKILVGGYAYIGDTSSTYSDFALVRYNTDGSLDTTFSGDGKLTTAIGASTDLANSVTLQTDGKILVAGYAYIDGTSSTYSDFALVRYNTDGSLDTTFSGDGKLTTAIGESTDQANSVTVQPDGKILVVGYANNGSNNDFALVRYNTDGSLDKTFDGDGKVTTQIGTGSGYGQSVTLQSDGKILVAGNSNAGFALVRYNSDGSLDASFDGDGIVTTDIGTSAGAVGESVTIQLDGKIVVAGHAFVGSWRDIALVRYNPDGSVDNTFSPPENTLDNNPTVSEQSTVVLDTNVHILDADLIATGNYNGATLTLTRHAGANTQDVFTATSGGTLSVLTAGAYFSVDSVTIGRVTANTGGSLSMAFNGNATQTLVDKAMQQIAYTNTSDAPPATVQIDWTFSDGNTGSQGDGGALSTTGSTTVTIAPVNDSPRLTSYLADKTVLAGSSFNFTIPQNAFTDPDGEILSYGLAMSDGTGVPPWLSFNAATRTLSGVPDLIDVGSFNVRVTAKDAANASASDIFVLTVHANKLPTGSVTISGRLEQGQILTASNTLADVDELGEISYQWQASGADISGASGSTYTLTQAEVGKTIALTASYTDGYGTAESVKSTSTSAVANVDDEAMGTLGVSGVAQEGGTLTGSLSNVVDADGTTGKAWQWQISDDGSTFWSDITDATAAVYAIASDQSQVGKYLRVIATTTDVLGGTSTFTGNSSTQVANVDDEASGTLSITGTAEEGGTLTNNLTGASDPDGASTTAFRWQELHSFKWSDLSGATAASLTIPGDQSFVGKQVRLVATTTDVLGGTTEFIGDANTITNIDDAASGTLAISGKVMEGETISANTSDLSDVDGGIASMAYQWQFNTGSSWSDINGATTSSLSLPSDQSYLDSQIRLSAVSTDAYGGTTSFTSAAQTVVKVSLGTTIDLMAYSWKAHTLLDGVAINGGAYSGATNASGVLSLADVTESSLTLTVARAIPAAEVAATDSAVNLQDAIAILKMIVGLDVNGAGKALSPYQALAADFDGNGAVGLTDAIGVLKHVVGLSAPEPAWHFANESDLAVPGITQAGTVALPAINVMLDAASPVHVGLVGYLSGDVDGSFSGGAGALDLDTMQPGYFQALTLTQGLNLAQFGIYG